MALRRAPKLCCLIAFLGAPGGRGGGGGEYSQLLAIPLDPVQIAKKNELLRTKKTPKMRERWRSGAATLAKAKSDPPYTESHQHLGGVASHRRRSPPLCSRPGRHWRRRQTLAPQLGVEVMHHPHGASREVGEWLPRVVLAAVARPVYQVVHERARADLLGPLVTHLLLNRSRASDAYLKG